MALGIDVPWPDPVGAPGRLQSLRAADARRPGADPAGGRQGAAGRPAPAGLAQLQVSIKTPVTNVAFFFFEFGAPSEGEMMIKLYPTLDPSLFLGFNEPLHLLLCLICFDIFLRVLFDSVPLAARAKASVGAFCQRRASKRKRRTLLCMHELGEAEYI